MMKAKTFVCISCNFKATDFLKELKNLGHRVILVTSEQFKNKNWPWEAIDEVFYMHEETPSIWNMAHFTTGFAHLLQSRTIDAVIALDDYDVEKASEIREIFRIPGMGQSTQRYFRDKLAMRMKAEEFGLTNPAFTSIFNDEVLSDFTNHISAPWVLKPRSEASAMGIKKLENSTQLWENIHALGEERHKFLLEAFTPGEVYHVDSLIFDGEIKFTSVSQYLAPPMAVSHSGGVFRTQTLDRNSSDFRQLEIENQKLLKAFGLKHGASHSEFIKSEENGKWHFLETSSRVGGAHIPELIEAATGVNLWKEWAKIEHHLLKKTTYHCPETKNFQAGLLLALSKKDSVNYEDFPQAEIVQFLNVDFHIGMIIQSEKKEKITELMEVLDEKIRENYLNVIISPVKS